MPLPFTSPSSPARLVVLALLTAACSDASTAPVAPQEQQPAAEPSRALSTTATTATTTVNALRWTAPVTQTTVSRVIGPAGGTLSVAGGLTLTVPKGAVTTNVTFSITRLAGSIVAYDFLPHGITFAVPVQLTQATAGTTLKNVPTTARIEGAYFPSTTYLSQSTGTAKVTEFRATTLSADRAFIRFGVNHFSGYMVSTDRHDSYSAF